MNDPMVQFLLSGQAHVYYGLLAALAVTVGVFLGWLGQKWLAAPLALSVGIFVDLWLNEYEH